MNEETNTENKEMTFEEGIKELDAIVKKLESGACSLEDAIEEWTKGMNLAKTCGDKLNAATEKVNKILTDNGELKDFETPEE